MPLQNPAAQVGLIAVEGKIPVLGLLEYGGVAGYGAAWVDEVGGVKARAARLALVAIGAGVVAVGAFAGNIAVGEKLVGFLVEKLHGCFLNELPLIVKTAEKFGSGTGMDVGSGARVDVETYAQFLKRILDQGVIAVYNVLRCDTFGLCLDGDGHTMLIASADHHHILAAQAQKTGVDIGRHVNSGKMPDVHRAVGIRESCCDKGSFKFMFHFLGYDFS